MTYSYRSGVDVSWSSHQEPYQSHPTVTGQRGVGNSEQGEEEENHSQMQSTAVTVDCETLQMQSQYQKDFPPPSSSHRRRTPALPQPDNIGINPAFRWQKGVSRRHTKCDVRWWKSVCFGLQVRVQHSQHGGLPSLVHRKSRLYKQAESNHTQKTEQYFWVLTCYSHAI